MIICLSAVKGELFIRLTFWISYLNNIIRPIDNYQKPSECKPYVIFYYYSILACVKLTQCNTIRFNIKNKCYYF